jgi:hypothetical protein
VDSLTILRLFFPIDLWLLITPWYFLTLFTPYAQIYEYNMVSLVFQVQNLQYRSLLIVQNTRT